MPAILAMAGIYIFLMPVDLDDLPTNQKMEMTFGRFQKSSNGEKQPYCLMLFCRSHLFFFTESLIDRYLSVTFAGYSEGQ